MKQSQLNDHGQPFSKKQRKASRHMMNGGTFKKMDPMGLRERIMRGLFKK
jgi:hypothetical protein